MTLEFWISCSAIAVIYVVYSFVFFKSFFNKDGK